MMGINFLVKNIQMFRNSDFVMKKLKFRSNEDSFAWVPPQATDISKSSSRVNDIVISEYELFS